MEEIEPGAVQSNINPDSFPSLPGSAQANPSPQDQNLNPNPGTPPKKLITLPSPKILIIVLVVLVTLGLAFAFLLKKPVKQADESRQITDIKTEGEYERLGKASPNATEKSVEIPTDWKSYDDGQLSLKYPSNFKQDYQGSDPKYGIWLKSPDYSANCVYGEGGAISLIFCKGLGITISVNKKESMLIKDVHAEYNPNSWPNGEKLSDETISINSLQGKHLIAQWPFSKNHQINIVSGNKILLVGADVSDNNQKQNEELFYKIISTVKF